MDDMQEKIKYYLKNTKERNRIRRQGHITVQKFNRVNWAKRIVEVVCGK